jgi:MoxR-like ATPase
VANVATLIKADTVVALQQLVAQIRVDDAVAEYAVRIVRASRDWPGLAIGAGPRGSIALIRVARAMAVMAGRDFVTPDDVKTAALPVLRHRVALAPESELEGLSADQLLASLLEQTPAPRA